MISTVFATDEAAASLAPREIKIRAMAGCAIVWFMRFRRTGLIDIPDRHQDESVEALVIDDNTGYGLAPGTKVTVSRLKGDGEYFKVAGQRLCRVRREGLYLVDEAFHFQGAQP